MKKRICMIAVIVFSIATGSVSPAAEGWTQNNGNWYYLSDNGAAVKGWLELGSEWYYLLPGTGTMVADRWRTIDGAQYYFNENGTMRKNGYIGEKYLNENGRNDSRYDIKVRGKTEKEILEQAGERTSQIPGWLLNHIFQSGWKIACNAELEQYGKVTYEDYETYVLYYNLESSRKLIFFIQPDYILQGIGMYVDYVFGRPGSGVDFQGAFSADWNMVSDMFSQIPIVERNKDLTFAEVFALYYSDDESVRQEFREYCPSLYEYMERFMAECYRKTQEEK